MKTTPTKKMEVLLCLTLVDIYIKKVALMSMVRLRIVDIEPNREAGVRRTHLWRESLEVTLTKDKRGRHYT